MRPVKPDSLHMIVFGRNRHPLGFTCFSLSLKKLRFSLYLIIAASFCFLDWCGSQLYLLIINVLVLTFFSLFLGQTSGLVDPKTLLRFKMFEHCNIHVVDLFLF